MYVFHAVYQLSTNQIELARSTYNYPPNKPISEEAEVAGGETSYHSAQHALQHEQAYCWGRSAAEGGMGLQGCLWICEAQRAPWRIHKGPVAASMVDLYDTHV